MKSILKLSFFVALMAGFAFAGNAQTATTNSSSETKTEHKCSKDSKKACCKKGTATDAKSMSKADASHKCEPGCTKACCANKEKVDPATGSSTNEIGGGTRKIAITEEGVPAVNEQATPTKAASTTPKEN